MQTFFLKKCVDKPKEPVYTDDSCQQQLCLPIEGCELEGK